MKKMIAEKMKRTILVFGLILLIVTGCQYLPIIIPTPTISNPTATQPPFPLILQPGSPAYIQNFAHMDAGCNWLGIAGQVFNADGRTIKNLVINVKGNFGQTMIDEIGLTGVPEADVYGPGGYEIKIADKTVDSENILEIRIFDLQGNILASAVPFRTFSDCEKNLIIVNFITK